MSTPPKSETNLPSNEISLLLLNKTGSKLAPNPFPPSTSTESTCCISKSCGSIWISVIVPKTTGCTKAVVFPVPGDETFNTGGLIKS